MSILEKFHYQITGPKVAPKSAPDSAPKLVFLHGVMGFSANWRRIAKAFESEYQILVYDQRGHGRSFQPPAGEYEVENYAGDLKAILDELGWDSINLVGHSMGGRVALEFAAQWPERVTRLVIVDIGPEIQNVAASLVLRLLDSVPVPFPSRKEAKEWFDTRFLEIFASESKRENLAAYLYANLTEDENKRAVWRFFEPGVRESVVNGRQKSRWDQIKALKMPTFLIRGEHSRDLPREVFEKVLLANPLIHGEEIKGAGHWVHSDQPELFIAALRRFLGAESAAGAGHV